MMVFIFIGMITWPIVYILMPIRVLWVIFRCIKPSKHYKINRSIFILSNVFFMVSVGTVILTFYILTRGTGSSGFLVAMFVPFSLIPYILAEIFRGISIKTIETKKENKIDNMLPIDSDLFNAVINNDLNTVMELMEKGANYNAKNELGYTVIDYARGRNNKEIYNYLNKKI